MPIDAVPAVQGFNFSGRDVRVVSRHGECWFVARDVADLLGYADTDQAVRTHCKAAESCPVEMTGQVRRVAIIPERDVYRLIMRSRLPAAEAFEEWVVGEVLPAIRRDGGYMVDRQDESPEELVARALRVAQATIDRQRAALAVAASKVAALDMLEGASGSFCITDAAKVLKVKRPALIEAMTLRGLLYRRAGGGLVGSSAAIGSGLIEHREGTYGGSIRCQPLVTAKGMAKLAQIVAAPT